MFNIDPFDASNNITLLSTYWWKFSLLVLVVSLVVTAIYRNKKKKIEKIWIISALIIGITFVLTMIPTFINIFSLYNY